MKEDSKAWKRFQRKTLHEALDKYIDWAIILRELKENKSGDRNLIADLARTVGHAQDNFEFELHKVCGYD